MLRLLLLCGLVATSILLVDSADQQPEEQLMTDLLGIGNATSRKLRSFNSSYPNQQYAVMGPRNQMAKGMPTPLPSVTVPTVPPPKNEEEFKKVKQRTLAFVLIKTNIKNFFIFYLYLAKSV